MAFSPVPTESKSRINLAGRVLVRPTSAVDELDRARDLAEKWRACHAYPINTFQATLRKKLKDFDGSPIAAQRLKRMPTIVDKLKRYPAMKLTTMQDIGGLRAILNSVADVRKLAAEFKSARFKHELIDEKDYTQDPRSEDGYRSVHLIYKYNNPQAVSYQGLRLELQIRTKLQHIWATAVETMGTFLGQALKCRKGDQEWLDFFALASSAFAHQEKTPPVPRFAKLSKDQTILDVRRAESDLQALEKMRGFSAAVNAIENKRTQKSWSYHLIILDSLAHRVEIKPYDRESFQKAIDEYSQAEIRAAKGEKIEPVLVSAGPVSQLKRAYPNFFLDINEFSTIVSRMIRRN